MAAHPSHSLPATVLTEQTLSAGAPCWPLLHIVGVEEEGRSLDAGPSLGTLGIRTGGPGDSLVTGQLRGSPGCGAARLPQLGTGVGTPGAMGSGGP